MTPNIVGLGGAGISIVKTFIEDPIIKETKAKINCLVIDSDNNAIESIKKVMNDNSNVDLKAHTLSSIPTKDLMEFIEEELPKKFQEEGIVIKNNYKRWVNEKDLIHLAGGTGKIRAASKTIYLWDYYKEGSEGTENLKDKISKFIKNIQDQEEPLIIMIVGLGGGSGSGIFIDLALNLKKELPDSTIWGLGILPSEDIDNKLCQRNAYAALCELNYLLTDKAEKEYGNYYRDPFDIFYLISLSPLSKKISGEGSESMEELESKKEYEIMDAALANLLIDFTGFAHEDSANPNLIFRPVEPSALIGKNMREDNKGCFTILNMIKYEFPFDSNKDLANLKIKHLKSSQELQKIKDEIMNTISKKIETYWNKIVGIMKEMIEEQVGEEAKLEIKEEEVNNKVKEIIERDLEEVLKDQLLDIKDALETIGKYEKEGSPKYNFWMAILDAINKTEKLSINFKEYDKVCEDFETARNIVIGGVSLTQHQDEIVNGFNELMNGLKKQINIIEKIVRVEKLINSAEFIIENKLPRSEINTIYLKILQNMHEEIKTTLNNIISLSWKNANVYVHFNELIKKIKDIEQNINSGIAEWQNAQIKLEGDLTSKEKQRNELNRELQEISRRRIFRRNRADLEVQISKLNSEINELNSDKERLSEIIEAYNNIQKNYENLGNNYYFVNSNYHKKLGEIDEFEKDYNKKLKEITTKSDIRDIYTYKPAVTESELKKVFQRVIGGVYADIDMIDKDKMIKDLEECINILSDKYNLWISDNYETNTMNICVYTKYYIPKETNRIINEGFGEIVASKNGITITPLNSRNPWRTSFYVMAAFARFEDILKIDKLSKAYCDYNKNQQRIAHSFLLEQMVTLEKDGPKPLEIGEEIVPGTGFGTRAGIRTGTGTGTRSGVRTGIATGRTGTR